MSKHIKIVSIIAVDYLGKHLAERSALKGYTIRLYDINVGNLEKFYRKLKIK